MLNKPINKTYALQIADLHCKNDSLCKAGVIARLNYLSDPVFETLLIPNLNSKKFHLAYINRLENRGSNIRVYFTTKDLIFGVTSSGYSELPISQANDINKIWNRINRTYHGEIPTPEGKRQIILIPGGYNISLTTPVDPVIIGGGSGSSGGTISPVLLKPPNPPNPPGDLVVQEEDSNLILYAVIGLGLFFLLK